MNNKLRTLFILIPAIAMVLSGCRVTFGPSSESSSQFSSESSSESQSSDTSSSSSSSSEEQPTLNKIDVTHTPNKMDYKVGETFVKTGLEITATYSDNSTKVITNYTLSISDSYVFVANDVGEKVVTVTYEGKTTTFKLNVTTVAMTGITITNEPSKKVYEVGDKFSLHGLVVKALYGEEVKEIITSYTSSIQSGYTFKESDVGEKDVAITYQSFTATFKIAVNAVIPPEATLVSIRVAEAPSKVVYEVGEVFNTSGLLIKALYDDNTEVAVDDYTLSVANGYTFVKSDVETDKVVTVTYQDKTTSFKITVNDVIVETELEKMNKVIANRVFTDPFEVRDYLLDSGYNFNATLDDGGKYGYSLNENKVVIYKNNAIVEPTECIGHTFIDYSIVEVSTFEQLVSVVKSLNKGESKYSTIRLANNITQLPTSELVQVTYQKDLELDLNGYSILAPTKVVIDERQQKWFTLQFLDKKLESRVYIHGGVIEANREFKEDGVEDDACCLSLVAAKSFRLNNLELKAKNGTECIGDLSQYIVDYHSKGKKVYISGVKMTSSLRAMSIAGGTWDIRDCDSIVGMVSIDGGKVTIDNCVVNASTCVVSDLNAYEQAYTNSDLEVFPVTRVNGQDVSTIVPLVMKYLKGAITFNDAICITSRRMTCYDPSDVSVTNSTLTPVIVNDIVTGYGIRYWDLKGYTTKEGINPTLENNTYPAFDKDSGFGGSNVG